MVNVPNVPGIPPLPSYSGVGIALLVADAVSVLNSLVGSQWGIFLDGVQAFDYNSVVDFAYKRDWAIADYQVEQGGFQSYDKVQMPFDVRVRVASGGSEIERQALLDTVLAAADTLDLYEVVTPEQVYPSCNISHVDFSRSATNGVGMIIIDIWFLEIRITSTSTFNNTQQPGNAGQQNTGNVSPQTPNQVVSQAFASGGWQ